MKGSGGVHKTEASRAVHNRNDAAKVDRPQARSVSLHSDHLSQGDPGSRIRDQYPSQVELLPSLKGFASSHEDVPPSTNLTTGKVTHKALRRASERTICQRQNSRTGGWGFACDCQEFFLLIFVARNSRNTGPVSQGQRDPGCSVQLGGHKRVLAYFLRSG